MAHYREKAIRAGPASAASRRNAAPIAPKLKMMADGTCAHSSGKTGLQVVGTIPAGSTRYPGAAGGWHQSQPRLRAVRAAVWRYALPLDTALVTSRVRVRRGGKKRGRSASLKGTVSAAPRHRRTIVSIARSILASC